MFERLFRKLGYVKLDDVTNIIMSEHNKIDKLKFGMSHSEMDRFHTVMGVQLALNELIKTLAKKYNRVIEWKWGI